MTRSLLLDQDFVVGRTEAVVEVPQRDVARLALEVTLLVHGIASVLTLRSPSEQKLVLKLTSPEKWARVERLAASHLKFELSQNQGEYLQAFLLRAYRDGMAEVNHIHLDGRDNGGAMDLTILFQAYRPPMSPEEAAKLMGD